MRLEWIESGVDNMVIYLAGILWTLLLSKCFQKETKVLQNGLKVQRVTAMQAWLTMTYFVFFIGLRSAGADTEAYIRGYNMAQTGVRAIWHALHEPEGLFTAFEVAIKTFISRSYYPFLFSVAAISGYSISCTLRKYTPYFATALVLFVLGGTYIWMINGMRQFLAVTILFAGIGLLLNRKTIKYCILVLIASGIHKSALIMLPVCFLVQGKAFSRKTLLMTVVAVFAVLFTNQFTSIMDNALEDTLYEGYITSWLFIEDDGSNVLLTLVYAVPLILAIIEREKVEKAPRIIHVCVNMSIICVSISVVANVTSGIFIGRLPIYFSIYNLILLPWLVYHLDEKFRGFVTISMYIGYGLLYYLLDSSMYYKSDLLGIFIR